MRGKEFKYDKHTVQVFIENKSNKEVIPLSILSSGEKQIVSLFANLYLTDQVKFIILFDEPELSLSIEWQERLIKDIYESDKVGFLMAVTHSPFILSDEFAHNANSIELFITDSEQVNSIEKR